VKEQELTEAKEELTKLLEANRSLKERNERLHESKGNQMNKASSEYKNYRKDLNARTECTKDDVLAELKDLWTFKQGQEREVLSWPK
jgi:hypothetical protein